MVKRFWQQLCVRKGRPARDSEGLHVTPIFGQSGIEQGLALLQMICETLRLPFRRDVVDRMLKGMVGNKPAPTLENLGQIADGLGLNAVLMQFHRLISDDFPLPCCARTSGSGRAWYLSLVLLAVVFG